MNGYIEALSLINLKPFVKVLQCVVLVFGTTSQIICNIKQGAEVFVGTTTEAPTKGLQNTNLGFGRGGEDNII